MTDDDKRTGEHRAVTCSADSPDAAADDIRRRARSRLQTEGAEVGVRVLIELAEDKKQKGSTRGAAAKSLVQSSGIHTAATLSQEDLADLPADQIRALLAQAQRALEARMNHLTTIDHEPTASPPTALESPLRTRLEERKTPPWGNLFD
jgi:hypothetical protein